MVAWIGQLAKRKKNIHGNREIFFSFIITYERLKNAVLPIFFDSL